MQIEIGTIVKGREIGKWHDANFSWLPCKDCGKLRWVQIYGNGRVRRERCPGCGLKYSCREKGYKITDKDGYKLIKIYPDDFFLPMADGRGYVRIHRLIMAKHLGRNLHRWEIVHHKNHIKTDNSLENLQLVSDDRHTQITLLENRIGCLEKKVEEQRKWIRLLQLQIKSAGGARHV